MTSIYGYSATAASNTSSAPDGAPEGMPASSVNDTIRKMMANLAEFAIAPTAGGTADALTVTPTNAVAAVVDGMIMFVRAAAANATTTPTFAPSGLTARTITKNGGSALVAGDIAGAGHVLALQYQATGTKWELLNPAVGAIYTDPLTTRGDLVYRNASATTRLAIGTSGYVLTSDGTDAAWAAVSSPALPLGYLSGGILSHAADTDHDITISAAAARDSTNAANIISAAITKQIDAAWSVGTDAGGLDTGSVANTTTYYVWLIMRSDTGVEDALFSTSSTAPTMPTNYDYKRLIGAVRTDGSANILSGYFRQDRSGGVATFTSGRQTLTFDALLTLTHMLPGRPQVSRTSIVCTTSEQGFAVDDELDVSPSQDSDFGTSAAWDATTVQVATGIGVRVINQSTFNNATITAASWRYVIRATYYP